MAKMSNLWSWAYAVESGNDSGSGRDDLFKIIDEADRRNRKDKKPLPMVTAMINVTMYRGPINKFKSLIRTKDYGGFDRRQTKR